MAASFRAQVVCPERALYDGPATALVCRSSDGELTVQAGLASTVADVLPGLVRLETPDGELAVVVHGGFLQVDTARGLDPEAPDSLASVVTVLAGVAEPLAEVDLARAEAAKAEAEAILASTAGSGEDEFLVAATKAEAAEALQRAELRLSLANATH